MELPVVDPHERGRGDGHRRRNPLLVLVLSVALALAGATAASAGHGNAALPGSVFEIDDDANLKNDDGMGFADWADLAHPDGPELRATDLATGQNDDSYKGGTKENTQCPGETTGSIPNNKSDLLTFHVYEEPGSPGFLNLAWSRVSDPSGTTLMDFEFNQSTTACPQGPNVVRTAGDLLIEYAIDQGGARAEISGRFWTGTAWGAPIDLDDGTMCDGGPCAVGTINQTSIPAGESDGLGAKQPRTFGEAQIDLDLIFDDDKCTSFGSAMLKSRSSDSFTSQLKDFIRPIPIDLQNCAQVIVRKQTTPDGATETFDFTKSFDTDPVTPATFSLADDGVQDYGDTVLFGTGYTVTEDGLPTGWELEDITCANTDVTALFSDSSDALDVPEATFEAGDDTVTFDIDSDSDVLDCTFHNLGSGALAVEKYIDVDESGTNNAGDVTKDSDLTANDDLDGWSFSVYAGSDTTGDLVCTGTTEDGVLGACLDGNGDAVDLMDLVIGTYTVEESAPGADWFNTDPGTAARTKTVAVTANGSTTAEFGNACLIDLSFEVNGVPSGQSGLFAWYDDGSGQTNVSLTETPAGSGVYVATVVNSFMLGDQIDWGYGINEGTADEQQVTEATGVSFAGAGYATDASGAPIGCQLDVSTSFGSATVVGTKFKDADGEGDFDADEGPVSVAFGFELYAGTDTSGTPIATDSSDADDTSPTFGQFSFSGLAPGVYTILETDPAGMDWKQSFPASGGYTVEITLANADAGSTVTTDENGTPIRFGNEPLSTFDVGFTDLTGYTDATITCDVPDADGDGQADTFTSGKVEVGSYDCTIVIVDP